MKIPLPQPADLAAQPLLAAVALLEVALVLTSDALRPDAARPWTAESPLDDDDVMAQVIGHECQRLRSLLAAYRRRLRRSLRRPRSDLDLF